MLEDYSYQRCRVCNVEDTVCQRVHAEDVRTSANVGDVHHTFNEYVQVSQCVDWRDLR